MATDIHGNEYDPYIQSITCKDGRVFQITRLSDDDNTVFVIDWDATKAAAENYERENANIQASV